MICPFRINRETVYYGCEPRNCTVHEWFEDCYEEECPYYYMDNHCERVDREIKGEEDG